MTDQKKKSEKEVGFVKRNLNGYTKNGAREPSDWKEALNGCKNDFPSWKFSS